MLYKKVRIKGDTENGICEVVAVTRDREDNTMYELENDEGMLLEEVFYPSELELIEEDGIYWTL